MSKGPHAGRWSTKLHQNNRHLTGLGEQPIMNTRNEIEWPYKDTSVGNRKCERDPSYDT